MKKFAFTLSAALLLAFGGTSVHAASAATVTTASTGLNVRSAPSASASVVSSLPKGGTVSLLSQHGDWWKVEYAPNFYGYCSGAYLSELPSSFTAVVSTQSGSLNVRSGAGTSFSVLTSLPKGTAVTVLSRSGKWSRILWGGTKTGYVMSSYLSKTSASLSVPSYLQTDSRWSSLTLGSSGKTIRQIGCAVTALSMAESYRTETAVTPAEMSRRLTYTPGGALYWPENYLLDTPDDPLLTLRSLLLQGTPVICGAKTSSGGQHWVVVTGYNGKGLSAENFSINDPGASSRTNLQQFFAAYPVFHRLVWAK